MTKNITAMQVAEVINQKSNARITPKSLCKRLLENGLEMSPASASVALNKMVMSGAIRVAIDIKNKRYYIANVKTIEVVKRQQQRFENKSTQKTYNKVFWGDKLSGVGTVLISGMRD
jgi:Fe2+ or Zn2+ uptake regulation protein